MGPEVLEDFTRKRAFRMDSAVDPAVMALKEFTFVVDFPEILVGTETPLFTGGVAGLAGTLKSIKVETDFTRSIKALALNVVMGSYTSTGTQSDPRSA